MLFARRNTTRNETIADASVARSAIRRATWFYIGMTVATFAFVEALAAAFDASDWSADAVASKAVIYLVMLTPAVILAVTPSRIACVAMGVVAALVTLVVGVISGSLFSFGYRFGPLIFGVWPWACTLLTLCWAGAVVASFAASRAAGRLKRLRSSGAQIAAQVFD
jgi:hypothetical protein